MDAYEEQLVAPIRDRLNQLGYHAVIVQDEPSLRGSFDLESKVDKYIEAAWGKRGWQSVRLYSLHLPKKMRVRGTYSLVNESTQGPRRVYRHVGQTAKRY